VSDNESRAPSAAWQPLGAPALVGDPIVQCLILIAVTSALFLAFPGIDPWFTGLFYNKGFLVSNLEAFGALREFHRRITALIPTVLVAVLLIKLAWPHRRSLLRPRDIVFILSTLAIGPGIVTNLLFKDVWGRPRPYQVLDYGGHVPFVGVWHMTDYCTRNCSFVSGEGSSAIWLMTLAILLPEHWRRSGLWVLGFLALALSLNRVAFGAHFLSDIVLAWWITLLVIAIEYRLLYLSPPQTLTNASMEAWLTEAGTRLRRGAALLGQRIAAQISDRSDRP
jgi:lipid A 4'-phosphatase